MSTLAKRLREAREDRGWTKAELRRQAKLKSASTLTELEKGDLVGIDSKFDLSNTVKHAPAKPPSGAVSQDETPSADG